jgi:hypothetical protein
MTEPDETQILLAQMALDLNHLRQSFAELHQEVRDIKRRLPALLTDAAAGWLDTKPAAAALHSDGIRSPKQLKRLLDRGVLVCDGAQVRDASETPGRSTYQFNIPACRPVLAAYFALSSEEREKRYPLPESNVA